MTHRYNIDEVEVSVDGMDVLVSGYLEWDYPGYTEDLLDNLVGNKAETIFISDVYPAVTDPKNLESGGMYSDFPLCSIPIAWKDTLIRALTDKVHDDWVNAAEDDI